MNETRSRGPAGGLGETIGESPASPGETGLAAGYAQRNLEEQLNGALERGELSLHYQPQFKLPTVQMIGSEALLRWNHPALGMIAPARFIPVAEECGLIVPIGTWVLQEACRQNCLWQQAGYDPIRVAVNISAQQFAHVNFVSTVAATLAASGLEPQYLELELAETVLIRNIRASAQRLIDLRALGVSLSMDDFGTGVLSLHDLVQLQVDTLKIDVRFIAAMNEKPGTLRLVRATLALGHSLGMSVTAEGVENGEQLAILRKLGCDSAQGYLFSAAVPPDDSTAYQTPVAGAMEREDSL